MQAVAAAFALATGYERAQRLARLAAARWPAARRG